MQKSGGSEAGGQVVRFIDAYAGMGAMRLGFEAGCRAAGLVPLCVWTCEIWKKATKVYRANFGDGEIARDIMHVDARAVPAHDILLAGFPCTPFSAAGRGLGYNDPKSGALLWRVLDIIRHCRPKIVLLENVPRFASHDHGRTLAAALSALAELGYAPRHQSLNAGEFGCPTQRHRLFIVAFRHDVDASAFHFPQGSHEPCRLMDCLLPDGDTQKCLIANRYTLVPSRTATHGETDSSDGNGLVLLGRLNGSKKQGYAVHSPFGHAVTFTNHGGGPGAETGAYMVNGKIRRLMPREAARAMGIPDSFQLPAGMCVGRKLVGNAVAVPVVREVIFAAIKAAGLGGSPDSDHAIP